jgi:uncharacterized protein (TIGR03790 family)
MRCWRQSFYRSPEALVVWAVLCWMGDSPASLAEPLSGNDAKANAEARFRSTASTDRARSERLSGSQLGLIVNLDDPASLEIADYYQMKRGVPRANIVRLRVPVRAQIDRDEFASLKQQVDEQLPATVQALAIAWTMPARVECNSITSAFARGFTAGPCDTHSCKLDQPSPYYDTNSTRPFSDFGMRPAMMLAGWSVQDVKALIDRGVASDQTNPTGIAALLRTSDSLRSLRARIYSSGIGFALSPYVDVKIVDRNFLSHTKDTVFYFAGSQFVREISSNDFPPGAVADNLTSAGGMLTDSYQTSILDFVAGPHGATGTFGTVSEPCAWPSKFPNPAVLIKHYTGGESLIEAYWKSVQQTFQGVFVGEPLAAPWKPRPVE